jgi:tetratricopeptide (TPR) repeat protein
MLKLPEYPQPSNRPKASEQALQGAIFALQMQRPAEAERIAAGVLKANRSDPRALQILSQALLMQGRTAEAIAPLEKAARRTEDPAIETQLAVALQAAGRRDQSLDHLRRATTRKPPFAPAFLELAQQLVSLGRRDEGIDLLKRGLALMPDVPDLSLQLGSILAERNDRAGARALFAQALACAPERADAMHTLAHAMQTDGDFAEAAEMFRRLLRNRPDDAQARIGLGVCLLELGQQEQALNSFRTAMRAGPRMYGQAVAALASSGHGRFWLRPSDAQRFMRDEKA